MTKSPHSICLVGINFGPLPNYFPAFLESCRWNPTIDWLIISDQKAPYPPPANVKFVQSDLASLRERASATLGLPVALHSPYKLCDFRPMYGHILEPELRNYAFWGHCDFDVIFGNIRNFLSESVLDAHDKILVRGNFSLYRNSAQMNFLYTSDAGEVDWKDIATDPRNRWYDEWPGIYKNVVAEKIRLFNEDIIADIWPFRFDLRLTTDRERQHRLFFIDRNVPALRLHSWPRGKFVQSERMLIHLQKRRLATPAPDLFDAPYWVFTPDAILPDHDYGRFMDRKFAARRNPINHRANLAIFGNRLRRKLKSK